MKISAKKIEPRVLPLVLACVCTSSIGCASSSNLKSACLEGELQKCSCDGKGVQYGLRVCMDGRQFSECACNPLEDNVSSAGTSGGSAGTSGKATGRSGAGGKRGSATAGGAAGIAEDKNGAGGAAPAVGAGGTAPTDSAIGQGGSPTAVGAGSGGVAVVTQANGGSPATGNGGGATGSPSANGGTSGDVAGAGGNQVAANGGTIAATGSGGSPATTGGAGGTVVTSTSAWIDFKYVCTTAPIALPTPTDTCPTIKTTFSSDGSTSTPITIKGKKADMIVGTKPTPDSKGPLVFYWHGYGATGPTADLQNGFADAYNLGVLRNGGMVVGFYADQTRSGGSIVLDWDNGHMAAMDELLACAIEQNIGIDPCRIHSSGFSMGGLMTTQLSYLRSKYLASVAVYSGGISTLNRTPADQDPANKLAVMVVHGGDTDDYSPVDFQAASTSYLNDLRTNGHFAFICNHGGGHTIPAGIGVPAWQFLIDHPYGVTPEPYQSALPASFPTYCSL